MAFGPIMRFTVSGLSIELAPLTRDSMAEFVGIDHGGGMQRFGVTKYLGRSFAPVLEDEHEWFEKSRKSSDVLWGIWLVKDGRRTLIGNSGLTGIGEQGHAGFIRQATSGSMIFRPEYWSKGIASAAHKARTAYAFNQLGLHRIKSAVLHGNGGSVKALERSGYAYVYTERNEMFIDGALRHMDNFECLNPLPMFWEQWWGSETPPASAVEARERTIQALAWAKENVDLP